MRNKVELGLGKVVLFGSGETSPAGRKIFDRIFKSLPESPSVVLLETPAGFELNSHRVIGRVAEFFEHRLQNYSPRVNTVPARKRGTQFSPDNEKVVSPILEADLIFMGPGSPTYAVRQLQESLAWHYLIASHRLGATLALASAATIAFSALSLPVYEIYKVGEDVHWKPGLNFFGLYGMPLIFVPHWNNNEGGEELDTRFCFMGEERIVELLNLLPVEYTLIGIDEKTALVMDIQRGEASVEGLGKVTIIHKGQNHSPENMDVRDRAVKELVVARGGHLHQYHSGHRFPLDVCCPFSIPNEAEDIPLEIWELAKQKRADIHSEATHEEIAPEEVVKLAALRQKARENKDWAVADELRDKILSMGWEIVDTPQGPEMKRRT